MSDRDDNPRNPETPEITVSSETGSTARAPAKKRVGRRRNVRKPEPPTGGFETSLPAESAAPEQAPSAPAPASQAPSGLLYSSDSDEDLEKPYQGAPEPEMAPSPKSSREDPSTAGPRHSTVPIRQREIEFTPPESPREDTLRDQEEGGSQDESANSPSDGPEPARRREPDEAPTGEDTSEDNSHRQGPPDRYPRHGGHGQDRGSQERGGQDRGGQGQAYERGGSGQAYDRGGQGQDRGGQGDNGYGYNRGGGGPKNKFRDKFKKKGKFSPQGGGGHSSHPGQGQGQGPGPGQGPKPPAAFQGGKPPHFQRKKPRWLEEDAPISLGNLTQDESFRSLEKLAELAASVADSTAEPFDFDHAYHLNLNDLRHTVEAAGLTFPAAPGRPQMIEALLRQAQEQRRPIRLSGVLDILDDETGGILTYQSDNYRIKSQSAWLPPAFIRRYGLLPGHIVEAQVTAPREGESCPSVVRLESVMGRAPEELQSIVPFTELVPYYPTTRILLESVPESKFPILWDNVSMRTVDCVSPVGFGQRGLIVAPPRTGKTIILQGMANSIQNNYPKAHLIVLLVDERPEEVTDFRRQVRGEVIASTFDEMAESHVHAAEMVIEKARRMVEVGRDVVILLDSITRLARAYNTMQPSTGKILSGGVESNALQKPKRFFGSARNIEGGGSLTIIATALVETGSKMDEVIFEEFKGTGNMELHLDRALVDKRIFPALSFEKSGTRKEELLYHPDELVKIYSLRRAMKGVPSTDAMEMLIQRLKKTKTNAEFLMTLSR